MCHFGIVLKMLFVLTAVALLGACSDPPRYEFVGNTDSVALGTQEIEIKLRNNLSGTMVEDAHIAATGLDMSPDGMSETTGTVQPLRSNSNGSYVFGATFKMRGRWRLSLMAQVPGEPEPVKGAIVITVR